MQNDCFFQVWVCKIFRQKFLFVFFPGKCFFSFLSLTGSGIFCLTVAVSQLQKTMRQETLQTLINPMIVSLREEMIAAITWEALHFMSFLNSANPEEELNTGSFSILDLTLNWNNSEKRECCTLTEVLAITLTSKNLCIPKALHTHTELGLVTLKNSGHSWQRRWTELMLTSASHLLHFIYGTRSNRLLPLL